MKYEKSPESFSQRRLSGRIASGPASPPPSSVLPTIPNSVGLVIIPPLAFHLKSNLGTLSGFKLNPPVI